MTRRLLRTGEGRLGCALWLALLGMLVLICWKAVPIKIASAELYDYMEEQAKFAYRNPPEALKKRILKKAKELDLPVRTKDVKVQKGGGRIRMRCTYTIQLEFPYFIVTTRPPFVTQTWRFELYVDRPVFVV